MTRHSIATAAVRVYLMNSAIPVLLPMKRLTASTDSAGVELPPGWPPAPVALGYLESDYGCRPLESHVASEGPARVEDAGRVERRFDRLVHGQRRGSELLP